MTATAILLEYVAPSLGVLVGNYMWLAPFQDVTLALKRGSLGTLNPLPWAFMLGNCIGWVTYGVLQQNVFVFLGNIFGLGLSVWFNLAASKVLYHDAAVAQFVPVPVPVVLEETMVGPEEATTKELAASIVMEEREGRSTSPSIPTTAEPTPSATTPSVPVTLTAPRHDYVTLVILAIWVSILCVLGFVTSLTRDQRQFVVGMAANVNLLYFYAAPLSTIVTILKTRSTSSLHTKTMWTNTANGCFWAIYGFAVQDYFIYVPNGLGALVGFVQVGLCVVFRKSKDSSEMVSATGVVVASCPWVSAAPVDDDKVDVEAPPSPDATRPTILPWKDATERDEAVTVLPASDEMNLR